MGAGQGINGQLLSRKSLRTGEHQTEGICMFRGEKQQLWKSWCTQEAWINQAQLASLFTHRMSILLVPGGLALATAQTGWVPGTLDKESFSTTSFSDASQGSVQFY